MPAGPQSRVLLAGATATDVTPTSFPVIVNGGFLSKSADRAHGPLNVRWLVLDDGTTRVALGVLDTCVIPADFAREVRVRAEKLTGIPAAHIMLSATHTHGAPSLMQVLGTPPDPAYPAFALPRIVEGLQRAVAQLEPAQAGWAVTSAPDHTHTRVWIRRPDRMLRDPFGELTVRANMHPGYQNPDTVGPSGPPDPSMTLLAVRTPQGRPIAVLANYAMHYFGAPAVSADYYGLFCERLGASIGATNAGPAFVGLMSQGASGDQHWMDYGHPKRERGIDAYAADLAGIAASAFRRIEFRDAVPMAVRRAVLRIPTRQPDAKRVEWARGLVAQMGDRLPKSQAEVYAREQLWLLENPERDVELQAMRIGDLGLTTCPCEVFAISGLRVKAQSPLDATMFVELANGEEGYIPPPDLHPLGGYNTWACRSAGLEPQAEPKIVDALLGMLEEVSGRPRRRLEDSLSASERTVLALKPVAFWRMNEWNGPVAVDATGSGRNGTYEPGVAFRLDGPPHLSAAPRFAGGRMKAAVGKVGGSSTVGFWFWNGLPATVRGVTGHLFARGTGGCLSIGGTNGSPGRLVFSAGDVTLAGRTEIPLRTWHHIAVVRDGRRVAVHLDGNPEPEISGEAAPEPSGDLVFAGRADGVDGLEGRLACAAVFDRALAPEEIGRRMARAAVMESAATSACGSPCESGVRPGQRPGPTIHLLSGEGRAGRLAPPHGKPVRSIFAALEPGMCRVHPRVALPCGRNED
jgi:hypothetical protein